MIRSMTGYGRGEWEGDGKRIEAEVKSFNHRFLDIVPHLPRRLDPLEPQVRNLVRQRLSRGRIEVSVQIADSSPEEQRLELDLASARDYYRALKCLQESLGIVGEIRVETLAAFRDIFVRKEIPIDLEKEWTPLQAALNQALDELEEMRREEGRALRTDLLGRVNLIEGMAQEIDQRNGLVLPAYRDRLADRVRILSEGVPVDPARLAQEVALMAERRDLAEELARLESHLGQFQQTLEEQGPVGRKQEFLLQEMLREANTIGAKAGDLHISQSVLQIKGAQERLREQVQNIE